MVKWSDFIEKNAQLFPGHTAPNFSSGETRGFELNPYGLGYGANKSNMYANRIIRGFAKGLHETIPGLIDFSASVAGSFPRGAYRGLRQMYMEGWRPSAFSRGFRAGANEIQNAARRYISDPLRRLQMRLGGRWFKNMLDREYSSTMGAMRSQSGGSRVESDIKGISVPNEKYYDFIDDVHRANAAGNLSQALTELAVPGFFAAKAGKLGKIPKLVGAASGAYNAFDDISDARSRFLEHEKASRTRMQEDAKKFLDEMRAVADLK